MNFDASLSENSINVFSQLINGTIDRFEAIEQLSSDELSEISNVHSILTNYPKTDFIRPRNGKQIDLNTFCFLTQVYEDSLGGSDKYLFIGTGFDDQSRFFNAAIFVYIFIVDGLYPRDMILDSECVCYPKQLFEYFDDDLMKYLKDNDVKIPYKYNSKTKEFKAYSIDYIMKENPYLEDELNLKTLIANDKIKRLQTSDINDFSHYVNRRNALKDSTYVYNEDAEFDYIPKEFNDIWENK